MANAGVITATKDAAPDAWRRLVGLLLQAFAAETARPLPDPPSRADVPRPQASGSNAAIAPDAVASRCTLTLCVRLRTGILCIDAPPPPAGKVTVGPRCRNPLWIKGSGPVGCRWSRLV
jgi:hypothetical protein